MKIQDVHFTLKDGRSAILRSPIAEDAQGTLEHLRISAEETEHLLLTIEDFRAFDTESIRAYLEKKNETEYEAFIVCIVDEKVAGNCKIAFNDRIKTRHRASVGIALLKDYWNLGIGTKMFEEMIRIAQKREEVTQLELEFIEGNDHGRVLYEKMGFRIVGIHPNAVRQRDGRYCNEYLMIREMKR